MKPSPNWRDSEAILKARAALRDYDHARALGDLETANGALIRTILLCEQAQQALLDEMKALQVVAPAEQKAAIL